MPRAIWEGSISFGLVEIPVGVYPAEVSNELSFHMLDRRDLAPIGFRRYNKNTGEEVEWADIVKGYEVDEDEYVVITDEELKQANVKATHTIQLVGFVDADAIAPVWYERPYYLAPLKRSGKSYALFRDTLARTKKVCVARVVLRTREHLAALMPDGPIIVMDVMRFASELRPPGELGLPVESLAKAKASEAEVRLAERLVDEMKMKWEPEKLVDEYHDDVLALIERKRRGEKPARASKKKSAKEAKIVDLVELLKKSVAQSGGAKGVRRRPPAAARTTRRAERPRRRASGA